MGKKLVLNLNKEQQDKIAKKFTFKNLKALELSKEQQDKIKTAVLEKLKNSKDLKLSKQQQNEIEKNLTFKDFNHLNLSEKQQDEIAKKFTFKNLKTIEIEDSENWNWDWDFEKLKTCETIYEYTIDRLKTIKTIYLNEEQKKEIKDSALKQIKSLKNLTESERNKVNESLFDNIDIIENIPLNKENLNEIKKSLYKQSEAIEPLDLSKEQQEKIEDFALDIMDHSIIKVSGEKLGKEIRQKLKKSDGKDKNQIASEISKLFSEGFNKLLDNFNSFQIKYYEKVIGKGKLENANKLLSNCFEESVKNELKTDALSQKLLECMNKNKLNKISPIKVFLCIIANELG